MSLSSEVKLGTPALPNFSSRCASGIVATSAGCCLTAEAPSAISDLRATPGERRQLLELRVERRRRLAEGVQHAASPGRRASPRSTISGCSWRRNAGSSWNEREMSVARAALATEVVFAWMTHA